MDGLNNIQMKEANEGYKMNDIIKKSTKEIYMNTDFDGISTYECGSNTRLMLVTDYEEVLIASKGIDENYIGTFSRKKLLQRIISLAISQGFIKNFIIEFDTIYSPSQLDISKLYISVFNW